jgi:hexosaminidase
MMRWRGAMLDISRHYFDTHFIKKTLSALAIFDYNVLHLHLTDDQGWRLESKSHPDLHLIGSFRKQSQNNHGLLEPTYDESPHSGFLTHEDIREIVNHAQSLGIEIVPEINIPGHTGALLAAYPQYGVNQRPVEVSGRWGISDYLLTPFTETFNFLEEVLKEVAEIFPSNYIHVGGDESLIDNWLQDSAVREFMKKNEFSTPKEVFIFFMKEIEKIINKLGKEMITWDDAFAFNPEQATQATVMSWRGSAVATIAMTHGRKVIQAPVFPTYFDYAQEVSEAEPLSIGAPITLEDVLSFKPLEGVEGVQFQLWTEYIQHPDHAEYMMWPRAAALAYRCWGTGESFAEYFHERKKALIDLGVTINDGSKIVQQRISKLTVGEYHRGFDTTEMMQKLEESAVAGEVAHDF